MKDKILGELQKVGKSLMLPVATLPAAGILMALGGLLQNDSLLQRFAFLNTAFFLSFTSMLEQVGGIIFANLPLLFAIAISIGLTDNDGSAGLAGVIGYLMMNMAMGGVLSITPEMVAADGQRYATVLGIPTLQTGVFGGIVAGLIAAYCFNRWHQIELPPYLAFFSGKRFVPMVTAILTIGVAIGLTIVWPPIQDALNNFSATVIETNRVFAAFLFGVIERALIPFGLHHVFYAPFWFQFGSYESVAGAVVHGDQQIFFQQMRDGVALTAGTFMTGKFPFMMFGLPAAAFAMYKEAKPERKKLAGGLLLSGALTAFLTGITEPLEFSFLFIAPQLYLVHSLFAGVSFALMEMLNVRIGMTLSGGLIDYTLFGIAVNRTPWWLIIPVGLGFAVVYFFVFRYFIRAFDLETPGREKSAGEKVDEDAEVACDDYSIGWQIIDALGGIANLDSVEACITRLRTVLKDHDLIDEDTLKRLGAVGVIKVGDGFQAIFGGKSDKYATIINKIRREGHVRPAEEELPKAVVGEPVRVELADDFAGQQIVSPASGTIIPISKVNDVVFSSKMMGDGFAVKPENSIIVSPVDGTITSIFPTEHAIGITSDNGVEVIIHVGIDTVELNGQGFQVFISEGDKIYKGQSIMEVDLDFLSANGKESDIIVAFSNLSNANVSLLKECKVNKGQSNIISFA